MTTIICKQYLESNAQLTQIANTLNLVGFCFGLRKGWQQKRNKNPDDGDDDHQLNQRKTHSIILLIGHKCIVVEVA